MRSTEAEAAPEDAKAPEVDESNPIRAVIGLGGVAPSTGDTGDSGEAAENEASGDSEAAPPADEAEAPAEGEQP